MQIGQWETGISLMISEILSKYTNPDALFLDVGANLGIHGLYVAKLGYRVWAIEPQEKNLIKVKISEPNLLINIHLQKILKSLT